MEKKPIYPVSEKEYFNAAAQIFEKCGPLCSELLPVETIMKVMAPFIGCKKSEYRYLYSIVDPDGNNPNISVETLASALKEYSDKNATIIDNSCVSMGNGDGLLDPPVLSESYHETLTHMECELRERTHMMHKLQIQLEFTDRQHEEAISAITAERDELLAKLQAMRDENTSLLFVREENREISEWSLSTEQKLAESSLELTMLRKRTRTLQDLVEKLEGEKQTLNETFLKTKEEYNRVGDIYSNRQTMLLEDNELLKSEMSELRRLHGDQDQLIQQLLQDKVHLENDLKDILNRSTRVDAPACMEQSVDASCTDASILRALDSLNSDFDEKNRLDFESFPNMSHKEDYGRPSNISLFDELRSVDFDTDLYSDTDTNSPRYRHEKSIEIFKMIDFSTVSCQTDSLTDNCVPCQSAIENNNNNERTPCLMCKEYTGRIANLQSDLDNERNKIPRMQSKIDCYKENIKALNYSVEHYEEKTKVYESEVESLNATINNLKSEKNIINITIQTQTELSDLKECPTPNCEMRELSTQTEPNCEMQEFPTQTELNCEMQELSTQTEPNCQMRVLSTQTEPNCEMQELSTQTELNCEMRELSTQTEPNCEMQEFSTQTELNCEMQELSTQTELNCEMRKLSTQTEPNCEMQEFSTQTKLNCEMQELSTQTELNCEMRVLSTQTEPNCEMEECSTQTELNCIVQELSPQTEHDCKVVNILKSTMNTQTENSYGIDQCDISTQYDNPCVDCLKQNVETQTSRSKQGPLSYCWDTFKGTLHLLTVICFVLAILLLYNVMLYSMSSRRCIRPTGSVPWDWMTVTEILSLIFQIEYVGEVPM